MANKDYPKLPLLIANEVEARRSWEDICSSPQALAIWIARTFAVDAGKILDLTDIHVGEDQPTGGDFGKLWIKNTNPPAVGIPYGTQYHLIYPYPMGVPILWVKGITSIPYYMRQLSGNEVLQMGLTEPLDDNYKWVIGEEA